MQPPPIKTDTPEVWPLIVADLTRGALVAPEFAGRTQPFIDACMARDAFGRAKYGTALQVENGRHPLRDALDEALDLMAYTRQHYERLNAKRETGRAARLAAWQIHLTACACAMLVLNALESEGA